MGITHISLYTFFCDECDEPLDLDNHSNKKEAVDFARQHSWTIGKKVLCPHCNGKAPEMSLSKKGD